MDYTLGQKQIEGIEKILQEDLFDLGVFSVFLVDRAGNVIADMDNGELDHDIYSLAALAAGNFGAVSAMANIVGEDEFSLLFHQGTRANIHFSKVMNEFLLVTIFGKDVSLGFLRLKVAEAAEKITKVLDHID